jgi:diaminohydroxyphosphoribosylaminopyrimidine deaminase/5-amino-6-(5-phosphoribosylamino)uracil reductase
MASEDPFPQVAGQGMAELRRAQLNVEVGLLRREADELTAPYRKLIRQGRPWVIAKWAMTLDGRIASRTGHSQWISNETSRQVVHALRGRVDAIVVGSGTVLADNPQLTARPPGPRTATRVVLDGRARTPLDCELVRTASDIPVLIATRSAADPRRQEALRRAGCEIWHCDAPGLEAHWRLLLEELGRRRMTNVLVEGGSQVLGSLRDLGEIDEVHVFVAPRLLGGQDAPAAAAGHGTPRIDQALALQRLHCESLNGDLHIWGRASKEEEPA